MRRHRPYRPEYYQANKARLKQQMHEYYLRNKEAYFARSKKARSKRALPDIEIPNSALIEYEATGRHQSLITQPK